MVLGEDSQLLNLNDAIRVNSCTLGAEVEILRGQYNDTVLICTLIIARSCGFGA